MSPKNRRITRIKLSAPDAETQSLTIRLDSESNGREDSIAFSISCEGLMVLMKAIQGYQVRHKLPIPHTARPKGTPTLSIVSDE